MPRLSTIIDRLLPPELLQLKQLDLLFRARALVGGILLVGAIVLLMTPLAIWQIGTSRAPLTIALPIAGATLLICTIALFSFRRYVTFLLSTHLFTTMHTTLQLWVILATGGVRASPVVCVLALQPILAFMMAGRRSGLSWLLIVIALGTLLSPVDGALLVPQFDAITREFLRQTIWIVLCGAFFGCFWYFDLINRRLATNIGRERDIAQFAAAHDPLTGLLNRNAFTQRLETGVRRAQFAAQQLALVYVDLDEFKAVNDGLGHHAGDHLLTTLAQRLQQTVRSSDSVARLGGDEFGILLEGMTRTALERLLPIMLAAMAEPVFYENREMRVSASIGAALLPSDAGDAELLSRCADHAMYDAKICGRNRFTFFSDTSH